MVDQRQAPPAAGLLPDLTKRGHRHHRIGAVEVDPSEVSEVVPPPHLKLAKLSSQAYRAVSGNH